VKPVYKLYSVFYRGEFIEDISATNKQNAIWGVWSVNDKLKKTHFTAEIKKTNRL